MSVRAVVIGLLLGWVICATTYFNDFVMGGASLVNHLLPISVLGFLLILLLIANPLLHALRLFKPLRGTEMAVIVVMGFVACSWPDAGFFRTAVSNVALPAYQYKTKTSWQQQHVMSYVPGGSTQLASGQITNPRKLVALLNDAVQESHPQAWRHLRQLLSEADQQLLMKISQQPDIGTRDVERLLDVLNGLLEQKDFYDASSFAHVTIPASARSLLDTSQPLSNAQVIRRNRLLLDAISGHAVAPALKGDGVLLAGGRDDPAVQRLIVATLDLGDSSIPWQTWWPVIRLWGGLALLLAGASLALAIVVHRQWSQHELLAYPIAQFVEHLTRGENKGHWPAIVANRLFWIGFNIIFLIHITNGLNTWFDWPVAIPTRFNFLAFSQILPAAKHSSSFDAVFWPIIFFSAVAFAFFLETSVSFSLGIAPVLYLLVSTMLMKRGVTMNYDYIGGEHPNMLRFGAYLGMLLLILYVGRRYYAQTLAASFGFNPAQTVRRSTVWAARSFMLLTLGAIFWLTTAGLEWWMAALGVGCVLLTFLVLARLVAETGLFFIQPQWLPVGVLAALLGFDAMGPTGYIVLAMMSTMLVGDPRSSLLPYLVNGFKIADQATGARPARLAPWLIVMLISGFVVAGFATLFVAYRYTLMCADNFTRDILPPMPFDRLASYLSASSAKGTLAQATAAHGWEHLHLFDPGAGAYVWMAAGLALVLVTLAARLRFTWWPLHPAVFALWGTFALDRYAFSFFLGFLIKRLVVRLGGSRAYRRAIPLMVGVIAGEFAASLVWLAAGLAYYLLTGSAPARYSVF